ncbi:MAG: ATP-NAD kinase, partial [Chloroflexi bacterium]|nr:ATP-NAD kinase [Chloroflexota bacterium]
VSHGDIAAGSVLKPGERREVTLRPGTVALDGEREIALLAGRRVEVMLNANGPRVVQIARANELLARR